MVILPSSAPLHDTFTLATLAERTAGSVICKAGRRVISQVMLAASLILTL